MSDKPNIDWSKLETFSREQQENKAEWLVRNLGDESIYGPYSTSQLFRYTSEGRVTSKSELKHPVSTKDQWVAATRIPAIAKLFPVDAITSLSNQFEPPTKSDLLNFLEKEKPKAVRKPRVNGFLFDIFDLDFERYATPWVVRFLWMLFLALWVLVLLAFSGMLLMTSTITLKMKLYGESNDLFWLENATLFAFFLVVHFFVLLVVRLALEACIALFDISNSLKKIAGK